MKKIRVAQFVGSMGCGGTETMLMNLFRSIDKEKYEFDFIVNSDSKGWYDDEIISLGGKIKNIKKIRDVGMFNYVGYLTNFFKKEKYDVVHSHTFLHSGFVMKAANKAGVKVRISHSHSAMDQYEKSLGYILKKKFLQKMILKYSTNLLACSSEAGVCLYGKVFNINGKVFKNPIRVNEISEILNHQKERDVRIRKEFQLNTNTFVLGHVGRFVSVKNHEFLIKIAEELVRRKKNFVLFLVGDGELLENIKKLARVKKVEKYIIFTGNVSNVYDIMNVFDIFLLPSFYEGLPLTAVEAQGLGISTILSKEISKETAVSNDVVFLPIDDGVKYWCDEIEKRGRKELDNCYSSFESLKNSEFNVENAIRILDSIYVGGGKIYE